VGFFWSIRYAWVAQYIIKRLFRTVEVGGDVVMEDCTRCWRPADLVIGSTRYPRLYEAGEIMKQLWEILVPTVRPDGRPITTRFHKVWDKRVHDISGGMTVLTPAKGKWVSPAGELFVERMIPVRIVATREEIDQIIDLTIEYYEQIAVLAYRISEEIILRYKDDSQSVG
jgi:hypothetical protein